MSRGIKKTTDSFFKPWALLRDSSWVHYVIGGTAQAKGEGQESRMRLAPPCRSSLHTVCPNLGLSRGMKSLACPQNKRTRHRFLTGWPESGFWVINSVDSLSRAIFHIQWLYADFSSLPHSAFNLVWALAISSSLITSGCRVKITFPNAPTTYNKNVGGRVEPMICPECPSVFYPKRFPPIAPPLSQTHMYTHALSRPCLVLPH